jgi:hypothetical protein
MANDGYVTRKKLIAWLEMLMMLLHMIVNIIRKYEDNKMMIKMLVEGTYEPLIDTN